MKRETVEVRGRQVPVAVRPGIDEEFAANPWGLPGAAAVLRTQRRQDSLLAREQALWAREQRVAAAQSVAVLLLCVCGAGAAAMVGAMVGRAAGGEPGWGAASAMVLADGALGWLLWRRW